MGSSGLFEPAPEEIVEKSRDIILAAEGKRILEHHLALGPQKAVSYLPINTIENVLHLTVPIYRSLIADGGHQSLLFADGECCIGSGAIYAYSPDDLGAVLFESRPILASNDWPTSQIEFLKRVAALWVEPGSPILPVIRRAFGET